MAGRTFAQKLGIKPGHKVLLMNAPEGYAQMLQPLPEGASVETTPDKNENFDAALVFVKSKAEVDAHAPALLASISHDGLFWFAYPKKTSKIKTDIHRDVGWDAVKQAGYAAIATISIDDTWTGIRFRPAEMVKRQKR